MQTAHPWTPVSDLPTGFAAELLLESRDFRFAKVTLLYSQIVGYPDRDLELFFEGVIALRTIWDGDGVGRYGGPIGPMCVIENSEWLAHPEFGTSRGVNDIAGKTIRHYVMVTLMRAVEVLALKEPAAKWIAPAP